MSTFASSTLLLGGVPAKHDLAPSVLFCILYGLLLPVWVYRLVVKASRSTLMIRPGVFVLIRIGTLAVRAYMSQGHYSTGLFIAEIIMLTVGLIALLDPLIECFKSQVHPFVPPSPKKVKGASKPVEPIDQPEQPKHWLSHVARFLKVGLLALIATGIYAGSISGNAFSDPTGSDASTLKSVKLANYILTIAVLGVLILATAFAQLSYPHLLDRTKSAFILVLCALLLIPSVYKLATTHQQYHWVHSSSAFYILLITFEFLVTAALLVFPATQWFPSEKARQRRADEQASLSSYDLERGGSQRQSGSGEGLVDSHQQASY